MTLLLADGFCRHASEIPFQGAFAGCMPLGISGFFPDAVAIEAGRVMLRRLQQLAARQRSFAFETTMASRSFARSIVRWKGRGGFRVHLVFLWLPDPELALSRIRERVRLGGHDVPEDMVRRRYTRGLTNFFRVYLPLADTWRFYDNSGASPRIIACCEEGEVRVHVSEAWNRLQEEYREGQR